MKVQGCKREMHDDEGAYRYNGRARSASCLAAWRQTTLAAWTNGRPAATKECAKFSAGRSGRDANDDMALLLLSAMMMMMLPWSLLLLFVGEGRAGRADWDGSICCDSQSSTNRQCLLGTSSSAW